MIFNEYPEEKLPLARKSSVTRAFRAAGTNSIPFAKLKNRSVLSATSVEIKLEKESTLCADRVCTFYCSLAHPIAYVHIFFLSEARAVSLSATYTV